MDYAEAREAFFQPRDEDAPPPAQDWDSPARRLRDAIEPLATIHYWSEPAYAAYEQLGLDFLEGYVWSRGCVLGNAAPRVVAASFGVFDPEAITGLLGAAREKCTLEQILQARHTGAVAALEEVLGDPEDLGWAVDLLTRSALAVDPTGRSLFAGLVGLEVPEEPIGHLWHACNLLREGRYDGHLAAWAVRGIGGLDANVMTEAWVGWDPTDYTASRAWPPEAMEASAKRLTARGLLDEHGLTDEGRELRRAVEADTDAAMTASTEVLGDDLDRIVALTDGWAAQVVERGWFPPDEYKRASG